MLYIDAYIIQRGGPSRPKTYQLGAQCDEPITPKLAKELQRILGFDPQGYGFSGFECHADAQIANRYIAIWYCDGSCE